VFGWTVVLNEEYSMTSKTQFTWILLLSLLACMTGCAATSHGCAPGDANPWDGVASAACAEAPGRPLLAVAPAEPPSEARPHALHALIGATAERRDDGVALGVLYEYRKSGPMGLGAFGDVTLADHSSTVLGGAGYYHPVEHFTVMAGPGVEFYRGDTHVLVRAGAFYDFDFEPFSLAPMVFLDFGLGDPALLIGLGFGFGF